MFENLPAIQKDGPVKIIVGLDFSGSIASDPFFRQMYRFYLSQLTGQLMYKDVVLKAFGWDTCLFKELSFDNKNILDLPLYSDHVFSSNYGRGGSNLEAVYEYNISSNFNADCIINLTDGAVNYPEKIMEDVNQNIIVVINEYDYHNFNDNIRKSLKYIANTQIVTATRYD